MASALGELLRAERVRQGLTPQTLARRMGYTNVDGCANRIRSLERNASRVGRFAHEVIAALGGSGGAFDPALAATDGDSPPEPTRIVATGPAVLVLRLAPAVYWQVPAVGVSSDDLVHWAASIVRRRRAEGVILDPPRPRVWLDRSGDVRLIEETPSGVESPGYRGVQIRSVFRTSFGVAP